MARNIFMIRSLLNGEERTIDQVSLLLTELIAELVPVDNTFVSSYYSRQGYQDVELNMNNSNSTEFANVLSQAIFDSYKKDLQAEFGEEVSVHSKRAVGFRHLIKFGSKDKPVFSLTGNLGALGFQEVNLEYFYGDEEYDFQWYFSVLKAFITALDPSYACVSISLSSFYDEFEKLSVKVPFGWMTYFANEGLFEIPNKLGDLDSINTEKGKLFVLTESDFTTSKEVFIEHRTRLQWVMMSAKESSKGYAK